jgi:hypothetical protein
MGRRPSRLRLIQTLQKLDDEGKLDSTPNIVLTAVLIIEIPVPSGSHIRNAGQEDGHKGIGRKSMPFSGKIASAIR